MTRNEAQDLLDALRRYFSLFADRRFGDKQRGAAIRAAGEEALAALMKVPILSAAEGRDLD